MPGKAGDTAEGACSRPRRRTTDAAPKAARPGRAPAWVLALGILACALLCAPAIPGRAQVPYLERDYRTKRDHLENGIRAILGRTYTISANDSAWDPKVTFVMDKDRELLVEIEPVKRPSSIMLYASQPVSLNNLRPVWAETNLNQPLRIRTSDYWLSLEQCNTSGCPRLSFVATEGTVTVTIVDRKIKAYR